MRHRSDPSIEVQPLPSNDLLSEEAIRNLPFKHRLQYRFEHFLQSFARFIYNSKEQKIVGATSTTWLKISIYYFFFYVCLALFYCGMVAVFGAIISRESPRYLYTNSEMRTDGKVYPGLAFRPMPDFDDVSITIYNDTKAQMQMVSSLKNYRNVFLYQNDLTYVEECSPTQPASSLRLRQSCRFSWTDIVVNALHPCSEENLFGWSSGKPCILIKLNQIYGWMPEKGDVANLVANWTQSEVLPMDRIDNIFITCNGVDPIDTEVIGNLMYYSILNPLGNPTYGGIPYFFFPYRNSPDHVQPFVLVQFTSLPLDRVVNVECRAWAPNIEQLTEGKTVRGMTSFNLFKSNRPAPMKS